MTKEDNKKNDNDKDNSKNKEESLLKASGPVLNLGVELVAPIILGVLFGHWLDVDNNTGARWTVILLIVGIIVGVYNFWKIIRKLNNENK
jgi:predicted F0F1-ATPase subunit